MKTSSFSSRSSEFLVIGSSRRIEPASDGTNSLAFWRISRRNRSISISPGVGVVRLVPLEKVLEAAILERVDLQSAHPDAKILPSDSLGRRAPRATPMPSQHERRRGRGRAAERRRRAIPARKRWGSTSWRAPRPRAASSTRRASARRTRARGRPRRRRADAVPRGAPRAWSRRSRSIRCAPRRSRASSRRVRGVRVFQGDVLRPAARELARGGRLRGRGRARRQPPLQRRDADPLRGARGPGAIRRIVATVQREVARRFVARPGDEGYGYLSVRAAALATGAILFDLPPGAFRPRPKVDVERARAHAAAGAGSTPDLVASRADARLARLQRAAQDARERAVVRARRARLGSGPRRRSASRRARAPKSSRSTTSSRSRADWRRA